MRVLSFNVESQRITKNPLCDFKGIVAGSKNYLQAHFSFSPEWQDCILVASFWRGKNEYAVQIKNNMCMIPPEALTGRAFYVSVTGQRGNYRIPTNKVYVRQEVNK